MQNKSLKTALAIALLLISPSIFAQETYVIRCIDKTTLNPINGLEVWQEDSLITKSNFLGYLSAPGQPNDFWTLKHSDYLTRELTLPTTLKFLIQMDFKGDSLNFSEGMKGFYQQIGMTMRFPSAARDAGFQGTCLARLSIDNEGRTVLEEVSGSGCNKVRTAIRNVFKKLDGTWDVRHAGEQIIMPFVFTIIGSDPPETEKMNRDPAFKHFGAIQVTAQRVR